MPSKAKYTLGKASEFQDLTLPSGATCQARRPGVQGLIAAGLLDSFDELTSLVRTEHIDKNTVRAIGATPKVTAEDVQAATDMFRGGNQSKIHSALLLMDRLTAYVVTQPVVWVDYQLEDESDDDFSKRSEQAIKVDQAIAVRTIDLDDKVYLLQWAVGGISDVATFPQGS